MYILYYIYIICIIYYIEQWYKYTHTVANYFTIFSLVATLSTDVTKSLQCIGTFLSEVI